MTCSCFGGGMVGQCSRSKRGHSTTSYTSPPYLTTAMPYVKYFAFRSTDRTQTRVCLIPRAARCQTVWVLGLVILDTVAQPLSSSKQKYPIPLSPRFLHRRTSHFQNNLPPPHGPQYGAHASQEHPAYIVPLGHVPAPVPPLQAQHAIAKPPGQPRHAANQYSPTPLANNKVRSGKRTFSSNGPSNISSSKGREEPGDAWLIDSVCMYVFKLMRMSAMLMPVRYLVLIPQVCNETARAFKLHPPCFENTREEQVVMSPRWLRPVSGRVVETETL
ncbi:uncharacterized protein MYCFIDRAFT_176925 [Pseudocercospora fijiensis CIRAD86]|uniref:Uncharacterized protein n=1 Tax=Pseudocercospora fijiensis (strain CIRAD86) TaxID=383855 RepID=M3AR64_PSEFD|nr:uncharacterized protein MYCFIDRAFT_176925 [Pseudocercospora fijiensis CIRAD86]EME79927.1 hypothetical protein MYCFIDRAFT_176925 [Pseudocercospora fijiensis CIRAD86]